MYTKMSFIKKIAKHTAWYIFNKIENNNNCDIKKNGEKVFIENLFKKFKVSGGVKIVFDIGANIGNYTNMLLDYSQGYNVDVQIHLFEPIKSCYEILCKKYDSKENITINNFGVSDSNTIAKIYYDREQSGLASLYQRNLNSYNLELNLSEEIELKRLDEYLQSKNIKHINFIKIDIEGHELKALEGLGIYLNSDFIDYIQFEYGGANLDSHTSLMEIYKLLESKGFKIAKVMPKGLEIRNYEPFMDNFQYSNYVAISSRVLEK